eukprot:COSAG02_NODE_25451_length_658_cov_2.543828_1_plen_175_part_00
MIEIFIVTSTLVLDYESDYAYLFQFVAGLVCARGRSWCSRAARRSTRSWGYCWWFTPGILGCVAPATGLCGAADCCSAMLQSLFDMEKVTLLGSKGDKDAVPGGRQFPYVTHSASVGTIRRSQCIPAHCRSSSRMPLVTLDPPCFRIVRMLTHNQVRILLRSIRGWCLLAPSIV